MTDKNDVLHAAIASIDEDEKAEKKQKANQKKKPEKWVTSYGKTLTTSSKNQNVMTKKQKNS